MFDRKYLILFIGKHFIDPGFVTASREPLFEGIEALPYAPETLGQTLAQIRSFSRKTIRVVLSEELVSVTSLSFPKETKITRELVMRTTEESIPEDLKATEWDFQTLHYRETHISETEVTVEVAVVAGVFASNLKQAMQETKLTFECVIPESCALAGLVSHFEGISLIVEADRESTLFVAAEEGGVWATYVKSGACDMSDLQGFIEFLDTKKEKKAARIILSRCTEEFAASLSPLVAEGYELFSDNLNPLIGVALQKKISGKDEAVLNLDMLRSTEKRGWRFWR